MKQIHNLQLKILQKLLFADTLRYTEMKPDKEMENNLFQFHLDQLVNEYEFIEKEDKKYRLTSIGKEYANRIDDEKTVIEKQAKVSAWVACTRIHKGEKQYLIYTRLKQPFYGCQGLISGKVRYGETIIEAAKRELKEETNLLAKDIKIVAIVHFLVYDKNSKTLLEDKFMHLCLAKYEKGKVKSNLEGVHKWVNSKDLSNYLTNPFESKRSFMKFLSYIENYNGQPRFIEVKHYTKKF